MKKSLLTILSTFILFAFTVQNSIAQSVKSQTEHIKSLKLGKYIAYEVNENDKGEYYFTMMNTFLELQEVNPEPNFPEHTYLLIKKDGYSPKEFLPDNMGFPVTLAELGYEGNPKMQKEVGYVPREIRPGSTQQITVIDGAIYNLTSDFNSDDPTAVIPFSIYVHESFGAEESEAKEEGKQKKMSLKERMKNAKEMLELSNLDKRAKKLRERNAIQQLHTYLEQAVAQQKAMYPKWSKEPANAKRLEHVEKTRAIMFEVMNKYNDDLKDTDEWRRIQENNRRGEAAARANNLTINNNTGRDIYIYEEGSSNGSRITAGNSRVFRCSSSYYYTFNGNSSYREGSPVNNTGCGTTTTVR